MNSFMSWIGGKKALRDEIIARFPIDYTRYIEVFGGGGWVLFHKPPGNDFEVYNDFNPNLANLYRCVRDHAKELCDELEYVLNSREDFDYIKEVMHYDVGRKIVVSSQSWSQAVIPAFDKNLVYFKWTVPTGIDGKTVYCDAVVNSENNVDEYKTDNNSSPYLNSRIDSDQILFALGFDTCVYVSVNSAR